MTRRPESKQIRQLAEEIFEVWTLTWIAPENEDKYDLNEVQALTLDLLTKNESMNVGELQRRIGVSPTKMSRVVRGLEREATQPLVQCRFNPDDRRKIDVSITKAGRTAHDAYRSTRVARIIDVLAEMLEPDRAEFVRLIRIVLQKLTQADASKRA